MRISAVNIFYLINLIIDSVSIASINKIEWKIKENFNRKCTSLDDTNEQNEKKNS